MAKKPKKEKAEPVRDIPTGFEDPTDPHADTGYTSRSTIDNEPEREDDEEGENDEGGIDAGGASDPLFTGERLFEVELSVTLKPVGGKAAKWPLLVQEVRGTMVMERLNIALKAQENIEVIEAMLRNPMQQTHDKGDGRQGSLV